jgi:folate-binding protein YgfZ
MALILPGDNIEATLKNLGKYIVFSKAKLHDSRTEFRILGCYGSDAEKNLSATFPIIPQQINTWTEYQGNYLVKIDTQRFECWITTENYAQVLAQLKSTCETTPANLWQLLDIRAGLYWVTGASSEQFTPHELNYPYINAVNFRKGCYTGQEIVARMHYRGKLKRHTHRFVIYSNEIPQLGSQLMSDNNAISRGEILAATVNENGWIECLAISSDDQVQQPDTEIIKHLELPYAIPNAEDSTLSG